MTAKELIQRLQTVDGDAQVQLIIWDEFRQCYPGLVCDKVTTQVSDGWIFIQGPGYEETMAADEDDEDEDEDEGGSGDDDGSANAK